MLSATGFGNQRSASAIVVQAIVGKDIGNAVGKAVDFKSFDKVIVKAVGKATIGNRRPAKKKKYCRSLDIFAFTAWCYRHLCRRFSSFLVDWKVEKRINLIR